MPALIARSRCLKQHVCSRRACATVCWSWPGTGRCRLSLTSSLTRARGRAGRHHDRAAVLAQVLHADHLEPDVADHRK
eukprot:823067-Rhodomonas_salina.1